MKKLNSIKIIIICCWSMLLIILGVYKVLGREAVNVVLLLFLAVIIVGGMIGYSVWAWKMSEEDML